MPFYRKKPVTIEAVQFNGPHMVDDVNTPMFDLSFDGPDWLVDAQGKDDNQVGAVYLDNMGRLAIVTLEGRIFASPNDYVIRDVQGEIYPCKPDIFDATYEDATKALLSQSFDMVEGKTLSQLAIDDLIDALQELARYRREGPVCNWPFGDIDVICLLAEALEQSAHIERNALEEQPAYIERLLGMNQMIAAIDKFLSDHCGRQHPVFEHAVPGRDAAGPATEDMDPDTPF